MTESDNWATPELVRAIKRIDSNVSELRADLRQQAEHYVTRKELDARVEVVNTRLDDVEGDVTEIKAAKAPWWAVAAVVTSIVSVAAVIVPKLAAVAA